MTLKVLGNQGPYPGQDGACSGYLVEAAGRRILLDCGSGVLSALQRIMPLSGLDAVVLSHLHYDHFSDLLVLQYYMLLSIRAGLCSGPLPVWGPGSPAAQAGILTAAAGHLDYNVIGPQSRLDFGGLQISFFRTDHPVECYAMRLEYGDHSLVYTGDARLCPGLAGFAEGAEILLADSCYLHQQIQNASLPHMSARECGLLAWEAGVGKLLLTHFTPGSNLPDYTKEAGEVFQWTEAVLPGACWEF